MLLLAIVVCSAIDWSVLSGAVTAGVGVFWSRFGSSLTSALTCFGFGGSKGAFFRHPMSVSSPPCSLFRHTDSRGFAFRLLRAAWRLRCRLFKLAFFVFRRLGASRGRLRSLSFSRGLQLELRLQLGEPLPLLLPLSS